MSKDETYAHVSTIVNDTYQELLFSLQNQIQGDIVFDSEVLELYSRDTSLFKIIPQAILYPKNALDIAHIVKWIQDNRFTIKNISITARGGGSDMTGGSIGEGFILDTTRYMNFFEISVHDSCAQVQPGVFYRDFELESLRCNLIMPVYPASKNLATFGGMISNNCAGEKSLMYGQMRNFTKRVSCILANGREYEFKEITFDEVKQIISGPDEFIAGIYRRMFHLIEQNYNFIQESKPKTQKNSSGYALWDVMNLKNKTFNLAQLILGSQGTLGVITRADIDLIRVSSHKKMIVVFLSKWDFLPKLVRLIREYKPESMEVFDDTTLKLGLSFLPQIAKQIGKSFFKFLFEFIPEFFIGIRMLGLPKLVMIIELTAQTKQELQKKISGVQNILKKERVLFRTMRDQKEGEKYFIVRRESFNLLRKKVKGKNTAPFIEDFCVSPDVLPEFLPKLISILKKNKIQVNIAGHAGDGNLHIIPLMNLQDKKERAKIIPIAQEVYALIISYGGTITAEHNDGIMRTPFLKAMYGERMNLLFRDVKHIFDSNAIFNPGKKVGGTLEDITRWMA